MTRWTFYALTLGFAVYWASNLLLWLPWSHSAVLGMTLMLTVAPLLWAYVAFLGLRTYPGDSLVGGAARIAAVLLVLAVVMDYAFFGLIRNAMQELYHPTTLYGYGFLICLPFIVAWLFAGRIHRSSRPAGKTDLLAAAVAGLISLGALVLIIALGEASG